MCKRTKIWQGPKGCRKILGGLTELGMYNLFRN